MYVLHVKIICRPEKQEEAERFFKTAIASSRKEPGCIHYDWFVSIENPCEFHVFEKWATREDFERHLTCKFVVEFRARFGDLLVKPNELSPLRELTAFDG